VTAAAAAAAAAAVSAEAVAEAVAVAVAAAMALARRGSRIARPELADAAPGLADAAPGLADGAPGLADGAPPLRTKFARDQSLVDSASHARRVHTSLTDTDRHPRSHVLKNMRTAAWAVCPECRFRDALVF
jgi:hypothetical protein